MNFALRPFGKLIRALARSAGYEVVRSRSRSRNGNLVSSMDPFIEQKRLAKLCSKPIVIFDVGAHHGQTSVAYKRTFPSSLIVAFEPFPESYAIARRALARFDGLSLEKTALGAKSGMAMMKVNKSHAANSLFESDSRANVTWNFTNVVETVSECPVNVVTLDAYLAEHPEVDRISILKLDVQGSEYDVLAGAHHTLAADRVDMVYSEIIVRPTYVGQQSLARYLDLFQNYKFNLHNFFNPCFDDFGRLVQVDALFVNSRLSVESM